MKRILQSCFVLALGLVVLSCGGSSRLDDTAASVFLTVEIEEYNPDIDICFWLGDVAISEMQIESHLKDPTGVVSANQDVNLNRWVITPYRTDGGSTASPEWSYDTPVYVPAEGTAQLANYRIYAYELLSEIPLSYLLPENGGFDPETGNTNIRQSLQLQIYGSTVSGKAVVTEPISIAFNFFCAGQ